MHALLPRDTLPSGIQRNNTNKKKTRLDEFGLFFCLYLSDYSASATTV